MTLRHAHPSEVMDDIREAIGDVNELGTELVDDADRLIDCACESVECINLETKRTEDEPWESEKE